MNIKTEVFNHIRNHPGTSYVEIERLFDELGFEWRGNLEIFSDVCENVIFWRGWNEQAINIINSLLRDDLIEKDPVHPLIYLIDGKSLNLPLVKHFEQYETPHWLPIAFTAKEKSLKQVIREVEQEVSS